MTVSLPSFRSPKTAIQIPDTLNRKSGGEDACYGSRESGKTPEGKCQINAHVV